MPTGSRPLFVTNPVNIRYLSGFVGVSQTEREAYLLDLPTKRYLFTSALYETAAKNVSGSLPVTVVLYSYDHPLTEKLAEICTDEHIKEVGFEETNLTVHELHEFEKALPKITFLPQKYTIEKLRMIKRKEELENIRLAAKLTDQCFTYLLGRIKPGISESRLSWEIEGFLRYRAGGIAFDPIVAFNEHSALPHYSERSNNPLRRGSLILLDFGAKVNGYCADMTRVVFFGTPKDEWVKAYHTTRKANETAIALLQNGERDGSVLDTASRDIITDAGYPPYPHSLGHAVGLDIHEAPRLTMKRSELLRPNMAITIEPGIYIEGSYGIRIEDLVAIKEHGIDRLSESPHDLTIL